MVQSQKRKSAIHNAGRIDTAFAALASDDPAARAKARTSLVGAGAAAVPHLVRGLTDRNPTVRWESAKALTSLHDGSAAQALVQTLEDEVIGIRWLAGEALIGLGHTALQPLLQALMQRSDSVRLRQGAHHVLHELSDRNYAHIIGPVIEALESPAPIVALPVAAFNALKQLS